MAILYRIGAASKLTGLSIDTLRAWERRYGAVVPSRGDQQRGYDDADIERLILLRNAVENGHAISSVAKLSDAELREVLTAGRTAGGPAPNLIEPLLSAVEDFNYAALNEQLGRMGSLLAPVEMVHQVVLPLMREVGERWHRGQFSIAQEHLVSSLMHHVLGSLIRLYRPAPNAIKILFTTPEGEMHGLGILAAAILAAGVGFSPIYLGPDLPAKEIAHAARRSGAKVVLLGITDYGHDATRQIEQIVEALPSTVELWIGGKVDVQHKRIVQLADFAALDEHYRRLAATA